ncbi:MAG: hypothetical protein AAB677_01235 [Patescibacteria group bacterium]
MSLINKEIELRSEIPEEKRELVEKKIISQFVLSSSENRISVLFLGTINNINYDIRVRTNSKKYSEVVLKRGDFHTHDRMEVIQQIKLEQFLGFVKIFNALGFDSKVMRRQTTRFVSKKDDYEIASVNAGPISYIEIEKMINTEDEKLIEQERGRLGRILSEFDLLPMGKDQFNDLCKRLTKKVDWVFSGSREDYARLESDLKFL